MGGDLQADPAAIADYAGKVMQFTTSAIQPTLHLSQMGSLAYEAFGASSDGGQFAEAPMMIAAVQRNSDVFSQFVGDVGKGIMAIACAAQACADTYQSTDADNANAIDTINFAFGDPGATRPGGLPKQLATQTLLDQEMANGTAGGTQTPLAVSDPESGQTVISFTGYTITLYPDGSTRTVSSSPAQGGTSVTTTVLTAPGGTTIQTTNDTTQSYSYPGGSGSVRTILNTSAEKLPNGQYASTGTIITTAGDGTKTIQPTENGQPVGKPIVVPPNSGADPNDEGPVQRTLDIYGPDYHPSSPIDWGDAKEPSDPLALWDIKGPGVDAYGPPQPTH